MRSRACSRAGPQKETRRPALAEEQSAAASRNRWLSRRGLLRASGVTALLTAGTAAYGAVIEPWSAPALRSYRLTPPGWPLDLKLRMAVLADIHAAEPLMPAERVAAICETANGLKPDIIALLGDYMTTHPFVSAPVPNEAWSAALKVLRAPLGVHAILGNHDWWDDRKAQSSKRGPCAARAAIEKAGIPVYENDAVRLSKDGRPFWLVGLGDQIAFRLGRRRYRGVDDLSGAMAKVGDSSPVILLAHEPDIFVRVGKRVSLTLSGHTHGGQVRFLGYSPLVPSKFGNRFAYGHVVEDGRHLVISGGLGCSIMPVRINVPPEIVLIELGA
ncbi:MAG: metallophosphoesterase [Hyphomicrobiaceae bacterium]|nr:MAG: metallophosphoesterase [Hyphomicrobiaceae bacterium]